MKTNYILKSNSYYSWFQSYFHQNSIFTLVPNFSRLHFSFPCRSSRICIYIYVFNITKVVVLTLVNRDQQVRVCAARWHKASRARARNGRCPCHRPQTWSYMAGFGHRRVHFTRPPQRTALRVPGARAHPVRTAIWTRWRLPCNTIRPSYRLKSNNSCDPPVGCTCRGTTPPPCRPQLTIPRTTYTCYRYPRRTAVHRRVFSIFMTPLFSIVGCHYNN